MKKHKVIPLIIFILLLSSLACNLNFGRRVTPEPLIPVTTEAVEELEESVEGAYQDVQTSGEIQLVITEAQLTSLITFELQKRASDELTIENPQIYLREGEIQLSGSVKRQGLSATVKVTVEVSISEDGKPMFEVVSASLGPLPVPRELLSEVEVVINKAFQEQIELKAPGLVVESILIENGTMTIIGHFN
jgi:uncharacterized protein YpmS